ncbi:MAG: cation-transporting P-type ATPase [Deltaproteobacteria bacterium]
MEASRVVKPVHTAVPGRVRLHVTGLYRSQDLKRHLESRLRDEKLISQAKANPLTGHLLVTFPATQELAQVISIVEAVVKSRNGSKPVVGVGKTLSLSAYDPPNRSTKKKKSAISRRRLVRLVSTSEEQKALAWHLMESDEVARFLETSPRDGLSSIVAQERFRRFGPNVLPEAVPRSGLKIFFGQFASVPVALLGLASGISALTGGLMDAAVILGVVVINAIIGYITESQAEKTIHSLKTLVRPRAIAIREGKLLEIGAEEIVPGDLIVLRPGNYIPADARIVESARLSIDESALTGEGIPVGKNPLRIASEGSIPLSDRTNMCYMGTLVTGGQGLAIAVATGRYTEMGRIQTLVGEAQVPETPMERQLDAIGTRLVAISGVLCGLVFVLGLLRGHGLLPMLKTAISLAVAAVPEGLPTVATTTLALGVRDMRRHNILIRHLDAIEALGAIQVICLDKTGTITENRMKVVELYAGEKVVPIHGQWSLAPCPQDGLDIADELRGILVVCALCNESEIIPRNGNDFEIQGTPTENSLLALAVQGGIDIHRLKTNTPRVKILHRAEQRNFMVTVHRLPSGRHFVAVKGSPSEVLALCRTWILEGAQCPLEEEDIMRIRMQNERMAGRALRVLGVAYKFLDGDPLPDDEVLTQDLTWLGLTGMTDPIRPGVKELIRRFHRAGIDTVMITGDQSPTAFAVGKELEISGEDKLVILDSSNISNLDPQALQGLAVRASIFSRVSPANKLEIVQALQGAGKVVAMTGDGVNDSPALRAADVGVAMGETGTDVAREVADVVIEDDRIETMILAISRGRTIYANVRKSLGYLLSTNMSEIMVSFVSNILGTGQPLTEMQLLWINLVTDIFPGLALSMEAPEADVLDHPPRDPREAIVRRDDMHRIGREAAIISVSTLGAYGYGILRHGVGPGASAMAFLSLTTSQLLHAYSCRSETKNAFEVASRPNPYLHAAVGGSLALQGAALFLPGLRSLLGIGAIGAVDAVVTGCAACLPFLINESIKKRKRPSP